MTMKTCKTCGAEKPLEEFTKQKTSKDGYGKKCKDCHNEYKRGQYAKNPAAAIARTKKWYDEHSPEWKTGPRKKIITADPNYEYNKTKSYRERNPGWMAAQCAKRRAVKAQATPDWANEFFVEEAYRLANLRTKVTGLEWHVDHIVPLQHEDACGLHTEDNLQVIPATLNYKKSNDTMAQYKWSDCFA
jgi:hypothetical protein